MRRALFLLCVVSACDPNSHDEHSISGEGSALSPDGGAPDGGYVDNGDLSGRPAQLATAARSVRRHERGAARTLMVEAHLSQWGVFTR